MSNLRAVIVDDEPLARDGMRLHLDSESGVDIIGEAGDGAAAVDIVRELRPDILFLDVQMPGLDGFDVIDQLEQDAGDLPAIVFVTAYDRFALRAFDTHAVDYILKPVDPERLQRAVERVRHYRAGQPSRALDDRIHALLADVRQSASFLSRLVVRHEGRLRMLRVTEIDWVESASNYVQLHVKSQVYQLRETMARIEERLDPEEFMRIHRSIIVRIDRIREIEPLLQGDYVMILHDGTRLTSSRSYRQRIRELVKSA
jgi:two-component system, LytTR family, response regulator